MMGICWWETRFGKGSTVVVLHDALSEEEIAEQRGDEEVGAVEFNENIAREGCPSDRVGDGGEYPI